MHTEAVTHMHTHKLLPHVRTECNLSNIFMIVQQYLYLELVKVPKELIVFRINFLSSVCYFLKILLSHVSVLLCTTQSSFLFLSWTQLSTHVALRPTFLL